MMQKKSKKKMNKAKLLNIFIWSITLLLLLFENKCNRKSYSIIPSYHTMVDSFYVYNKSNYTPFFTDTFKIEYSKKNGLFLYYKDEGKIKSSLFSSGFVGDTTIFNVTKNRELKCYQVIPLRFHSNCYIQVNDWRKLHISEYLVKDINKNIFYKLSLLNIKNIPYKVDVYTDGNKDESITYFEEVSEYGILNCK